MYLVVIPSMHCRDLFDRLDVDGSGGISLEELSQGLEEQGYHVTPIEVEQLMARLDLDADGHIQMDEFAASMIDWKDVRFPSWTLTKISVDYRYVALP